MQRQQRSRTTVRTARYLCLLPIDNYGAHCVTVSGALLLIRQKGALSSQLNLVLVICVAIIAWRKLAVEVPVGRRATSRRILFAECTAHVTLCSPQEHCKDVGDTTAVVGCELPLRTLPSGDSTRASPLCCDCCI